MLALPIALKWALVGRYRSGQHYLWSFWMWRMEIAYEVELYVASIYHPVIGGTRLFVMPPVPRMISGRRVLESLMVPAPYS